MNEHVLHIGAGRRLTATLTQPPASAPAKSTGILLLNAGVIHRMGPHRINVKLARHLAAQGFTVMRLDLSGLGDSLNADRPQSFEQQAVEDLRAAMDQLQRLSPVTRFALAGICSGAQHGVATALQDDRLSALWMMDIHTYPTPRTHWVRAKRQLRQAPVATLRGWTLRVLRALIPKTRPVATKESIAPLDDNPYGRPSKEAFAADIQALLMKKVRLQLVFSNGVFWRHNYPAQWRDAFKAHGAVAQVPNELLLDVDHTASTLHAQRQLVASVSRFAAQLD